jgi:hypothetical protein
MTKERLIEAIKSADIVNDDMWWENLESQISNPYARGYLAASVSCFNESLGFNTEDFREEILEKVEYDIWQGASGTSSRPQENAQPAGFDLSAADLEKLLSQCLKPEEIAGDAAVQLDRIKELIHWFRRFADRSANAKWFHSHAFELAYYIATTAGNRFIDLEAVKREAWIEGVNITPNARAIAVTLGLVSTTAAPQPAGPVWVKASTRLPGFLIPVKWRDGNDHSHETDKFPLLHMAKPFLATWEWLDESHSAPHLFTREQVMALLGRMQKMFHSGEIKTLNEAEEYMNTKYGDKTVK